MVCLNSIPRSKASSLRFMTRSSLRCSTFAEETAETPASCKLVAILPKYLVRAFIFLARAYRGFLLGISALCHLCMRPICTFTNLPVRITSRMLFLPP